MSSTHNHKEWNVEDLNQRFEKHSPIEFLSWFLKEFKGRIALASSLGAEDQVLTHMVWSVDPNARVFTLDTGRLFPETYDLIDSTNRFFNRNIEVYFPDFHAIESMVAKDGVNLFYRSIEHRKRCCDVRKLQPLKRAFENLEVWICGLRRDQSITRYGTKMVEWDEANGLVKLNPLIHWSEKQVWDYISQYQIPYNSLHDKGFPSIGCHPCTRAVEPGQEIRSGRWWWEEPQHKECGLHNRPSKKE